MSTIYLFDINKTKKVDTSIKTFEYKENLSITKLSLKIFTDSLSPLKIIRRVKSITKIESLQIISKLFFMNTPIINKENMETDKKISGIKNFMANIFLFQGDPCADF